MAATQNYRFSATVKDAKGNKAACTAYLKVDPAQTVTQLLAELASWVSDLDALSDGQITESRADLIGPGGSTKSGDVLSDSSNILTLAMTFGNSVDNRVWSQAIPSRSDSLLVGGDVDPSNAGIAAYATKVTTASGPYVYTSNEWKVLNAHQNSFLTGRKRAHTVRRVKPAA